MRRLFTLLLLSLTIFAAGTKAQVGTTCNADFNFTVSGSTAQFVPVVPGDSLSTIHQWFFGDGSPVSGAVAPGHTYGAAGVYNVKHVLKRITPNGALACADTVVKAVTIANTSQPCNLQANFVWVRDSVQTNTYYFSNLTVNFLPTDSITWNFGDGTPASNAINPVHVYAQPGTYNVCLRIKRLVPAGTPPCISEVCRTLVVTAPCNLQAYFTFTADSTQPNKIYFNNATVNYQPGDSLIWNFGDGSFGSGNNPTHIYTQPGTYNVCIKVLRYNVPGTTPCVSDFCRQVVIQPQVQPCNLVANFIWRQDSIAANKIFFTNTSAGFQAGDSIRWTFGDGTSSFDLNPSHIYAQPGTYTVCLRVKRLTATGATPCVSEICKVVVVLPQVQPCNLVANFIWRQDSIAANKIFFTNTSAGFQAGDSIRWTFGDGTSSFDLNPSHIYAQPGTYTVCLRIKRNGNSATTPPCVSEICKVVVVLPQVQPCNLVANFIWRQDSTGVNRILFNNTSAGFQPGDSIRWTFGDGTSSLDVNPAHVYAQPGTYTVCLRVKRLNTAGLPPCVSEICKVVVVLPQVQPCNLAANFTWRRDSTNANKIFFTNTSFGFQPGDSIRWTFGDGTASFDVNPTHVYAQSGTYTVCLRVKRNSTTPGAAPCVREVCKMITVGVPCDVTATFNFVRLATNSQTYVFTPVNINPAYQYIWTFGDGSTSQNAVATHTYLQAGNYTVCLKVIKNNTCFATYCRTVSVVAPFNCSNINVNFVYQRDAFMPNKLYFFAISNFPLLQQRWTITKVPTATSPVSPIVTLFQSNPVYVFSDTGLYRVCLRTVTLGGCVKEVCQLININQVLQQQCQLYAYPNPAQSSVNVNVYLTQAQNIYAYVYNSQNILVTQKVQAGATGNNIVNINVANLAPGLYTIKLIYGNKTCIARFQKI